jgi:hypothetical protein
LLVVVTVEAQVGPMLMTGTGSGTLFLLMVFALPTAMRGCTLPLLRKEQRLHLLEELAASAVLKAGTVLLLLFVFCPTPLTSMSTDGTKRSAILDG